MPLSVRHHLIVLLVVAAAILFICPVGWAEQAAITFSVVGDVPYSESELNTLEQHVTNHNLYSPSEFLVHVGDMVGSNESCFEARYDDVAAILTGLTVPTYILPGDNEWNDCSNPDLGWSWWTEHLFRLETSYCGTPVTEYQTVRPENFAFVSKGVLFVGINIVGGSVGNSAAWNLRLQQDADWVSQQLQAHGSEVRAAVVFGHAGPSANRHTFFDPFGVAAVAFGKPVLYAQGDGHSWRWDQPLPSAQNVRRMQVQRGTTPPVQLTVTLDPLNPFVFNRTPWPQGTAPVNRPPCVDVGADISLPSGAAAALDGFVTDDHDPPGTLTTLWTSVGGPGTVTFQNPNAATTSAQFGAAGTYTLRLTANDGTFATIDELNVLVPWSGPCSSNADCSDGLYCNGAETCVAGNCQVGAAVNCGDGVSCTTDSCDEATDSCTHTASNVACSDGFFCTGAETCNATLGCQAGSAVDCVDAIACTTDSCNETTDSCSNVPNNAACSDGLFCTSAETCSAALGCQAASPVNCNDGAACTVDSCDESTDSCSNVPNHGLCADAEACTTDTCVVGSGCQHVNTCGGSGEISFAEARSGASVSSNTVATAAALSGVANDLYLAAVSYKPNTVVTGVAGLGLAWTRVGAQCAGRSQTGIEVWKAQGVPNGNGPVTATMSATVSSAVIAVSRYSGVDVGGPIGSVESANTRGVDGACSGGTDSASYSYALSPVAPGSVVYSAVAMRGKTHTPGAGFLERAEVVGGSGGGASSAAASDRTAPSGTSATVNGTLNGAADWAALAVELRPTITSGCNENLDCNDGAFCNGVETCVAGACQAGSAPACDDGVGCTTGSCNETNDDCDHAPDDAACDNGQFCDGAEICDPGLGCQGGLDPCPGEQCSEVGATCLGCEVDADCDDGLFCNGTETCVADTCQPGTPVACDDGVACTTDSCNEPTDSCTHTPNDTACSDGLFCNGAETCHATLGCQTVAPLDCADGFACTADSCNESTDSCDHAPNDAVCGNGQFCDGAEICNPASGCQNGPDPCPGGQCDEGGATCIDCLVDADCNDALFCNGVETCIANSCQAGTPVGCDDGVACTADACDEPTDSCTHTPSNATCSDGLFCNGAETCHASLGCQAGAPVDCADSFACTADSCDESTDSCSNAPDHGLCADVDTCTTDTCVVGSGCQHVNTCSSGQVSFVEARSGISVSSNTVATTAALSAVTNDLYLAAVSYKPNTVVTGVTGLGLAWTRMGAQCAGRNQTGIEVWKAQGATSGNGLVTATMSATVSSAVIAVTRYSGVDASIPIGSIESANSRGVDGACSGGVDGTAYSYTMSPVTPGSFVYSTVAMRGKTHTPGAGYQERLEVLGGSGGSASSAAASDKTATSGTSATVNGTFSGAADWAAMAVELRPAPGSP